MALWCLHLRALCTRMLWRAPSASLQWLLLCAREPWLPVAARPLEVSLIQGLSELSCPCQQLLRPGTLLQPGTELLQHPRHPRPPEGLFFFFFLLKIGLSKSEERVFPQTEINFRYCVDGFVFYEITLLTLLCSVYYRQELVTAWEAESLGTL